MSIDGAGENYARYCAHRGGLSGGAVRPSFGAGNGFRAPCHLAGLEVERVESAALLRVEHQSKALRRSGVWYAPDSEIGDCDVDLLSIGCRAPLAAAQSAARAGAGLPEDLSSVAFIIGIDGVHHAGFLADHQRSRYARETHEYRRLAEVEIGTVRLRAIGQLRGIATVGVGILFGQLFRPQQLSGLEIHGEDGVARFGGRIGVVVTGGDVEGAELLVEGRRRPDSGSGGSALLSSR